MEVLEEKIVKYIKLPFDSTDVIFEDYGNGKGKLIISNPYDQNFSTYWGAMGNNDLKSFIKSCNISYLTNRLKHPSDRGVFDGKLSVKNIRNIIKNDFSYDLPFYKFMDAQKVFRRLLKEAESCENENEFVDYISNIPNELSYSTDLKLDVAEEREFLDIVKSVCSEPWYYIETSASNDELFLNKVFKYLKDKL